MKPTEAISILPALAQLNIEGLANSPSHKTARKFTKPTEAISILTALAQLNIGGLANFPSHMTARKFTKPTMLRFQFFTHFVKQNEERNSFEAKNTAIDHRLRTIDLL